MTADNSSGEKSCKLADHKVTPKYRTQVMKYYAGLSKMLILYRVLYWLLHLQMGQPFEQESRSSRPIEKKLTHFINDDLKHTYVVQQHCTGRDTCAVSELSRQLSFVGPV